MRLQFISFLWISQVVLTNIFSQQTYANSNTTIIVNGNGTDDGKCCQEGECVCSSLSEALESVQDNHNVTIMITSKSIPLTSVVQIRNCDRIIITGLRVEKSIIYCDNNGGLSCDNCSNLALENIVWDHCGQTGRSDLLGAVYILNSYNISVINCYFQNSSLSGFALLNAAGNLEVHDSFFLSNHALSNCTDSNGGGMLVTNVVERQKDVAELNIHVNNSSFSHNGYIDIDNNVSCVVDGGGLSINTPDNTNLTLSINHSIFESNMAYRGGGVYLNTNISSVLVTYTNFTNNFGIEGSGVWISYKNDTILNASSLGFTFSNFFNNVGASSTFYCFLKEGNVSINFESCMFSRNKAFSASLASTIYFLVTSENSTVSIRNSNFNDYYPAAIHMEILSSLVHVNLATLTFTGTKPELSLQHAIYINAEKYCILNFKGLVVTDYFSNATHGILYIYGGYSPYGYYLKLTDSTFTNNYCSHGSIIYINFESDQRNSHFSNTTIISNCMFRNNTVEDPYAIAYVENEGEIWFVSIESSIFINNIGSALYISNCGLELKGDMLFQSNTANSGAAIFCTKGSLTRWNNGSIDFVDNYAKLRGGAIYVSITQPCYDRKFFIGVNNVSVNFSHNSAEISGSSMYFSLSEECSYNTNISDNYSLLYYPSKFNYSGCFDKEVTTSPFKLNLSSPAVCIDANDTNSCSACSISGIMLGQEIVLPAKILDYFGSLTEPLLFLVTCVNNCEHYQFSGSNPIFVNNYLQDISVKGKEVVYDVPSVTLLLSSVKNSNDALKEICINFTVNLANCFPGFIYDQAGKICVCYNNDILTCNGKNAKIKHGYWFGIWKGQATTVFCPLGYCSFSKCDDSEYCALSHVQDEQCHHHRAGPSCSNCNSDYILSFDSNHCVKKSSCFTGVTVVILISCFLYCGLLIGIIIILMNFDFEIGIGYAYGILYFYSIIDILLEDQLSVSDDAVYRFVAILSGFAKLTPQFLATLCFIDSTEWSGIDQQFFHYVHPVGVTLILILIVFAARYSTTVTILIRKSILRAICLLLLITYTSITSTSVELLRPLKFQGISETFTYSSPDKLYYHGRHIFYGIIAIICTIVIVIGFPLLLILEPFISHKVDFSRIRPLLDQYQGCFKDKYRVFAAFYLLCRLAIITVVYAEHNNYYNRLFTLNVMCIVIAMIHASVMPYKNNNLNALDEIILLAIIFVVNFSNGFSYTTFNDANSELTVAIVTFPLIAFVVYIIKSLKCNIFCGRFNEQNNILDYDSLTENNSNENDINDINRPRHMLRLPTKYSESDNYNTFQESLLGMSNNDEIENN